MGRVHVSSTIDIPTYRRLETFARDHGMVHSTRDEVNVSDAVRCALALALENDEAEEGQNYGGD